MKYYILLGVCLSSVCFYGCSPSEPRKEPIADWSNGDQRDGNRDNGDWNNRNQNNDNWNDRNRDNRDWNDRNQNNDNWNDRDNNDGYHRNLENEIEGD